MIYLIKSYVNGDLGVSDHIVEEVDSVMGIYDTTNDAIRFLRNRQMVKQLQKEPIREYEESSETIDNCYN